MTALQKLPPRWDQERRNPLSCSWEQPSAIAHEMRWLTRRQQDEVGKDYEPYAPAWDTYFAFERAGSCRIWTARTMSGVLVGYIVVLLVRGLHSVDHVFANLDLVYMPPEWREGLTGYRFMKACRDSLRKDPMINIIRGETNELYMNGRMRVLYKRLGFRKMGEVWSLNNDPR